jgi:hypothetical protein
MQSKLLRFKNANFIRGLNLFPRILLISTNGITSKINNLENIVHTPNNLLGIDAKNSKI